MALVVYVSWMLVLPTLLLQHRILPVFPRQNVQIIASLSKLSGGTLIKLGGFFWARPIVLIYFRGILQIIPQVVSAELGPIAAQPW